MEACARSAGPGAACSLELAAALRDHGGVTLMRKSLQIMGASGFFPMEMPLLLPPTIIRGAAQGGPCCPDRAR